MVASSVNRTRTSLALLVVVAATLCLEGNAFAEKVCYQDARGRISIRRGPGAVPVPCPNQEAETPADLVTPPPGSAPAAGTADLGPEFGRVPNAVSPVPVPPERNRKTDECMARSNCLDSSVVEAIPDRWRIVDALPGYESRWWDPYNRNVLKADKPVTDSKWFFNFSGISDTVYEYRQVPTPVGLSSTGDAGEIDVFGSADQQAVVQTIATEFVYYKGNTVFQPPDYEFRFTPVFNLNYVQLDETLGVNVDPREGDDRTDSFVGIQAAFIDKHLRNVSDRFDFDSIRIGIQPFSSDFRGFLFQDNQLGIRLFGTRANNVFQYNLGYFRRLEKDTNSGLNDLGQSLRDDDVVVANLYWQDLFVKGFTSQATILYNRNREDDGNYYNKNGFIERPASVGGERPRKYDVVYLGYNGDGHFGRLNLTASLYGALGKGEPGVFSNQEEDIRAGFFAAEAGFDFSWIRTRFSVLYGSGDKDPYDNKATGFDAVFENPQFAGADTSYWVRQSVPLIAGGRVALSTRNGVLNSLRSSKEQGQSNFVNPGIGLVGLGADLDLLPELRLSLNWNYLRFDTTAVLEAARNQAPVDEEIGHDLSMALTYRPMMSQNIVVRASYARLLPGQGFKDLFPDEDAGYALVNVVLNY